MRHAALTESSTSRLLPERDPRIGELVHVRSRRWLVEEVVPSPTPGVTCLVRLACADDDAQGQTLDVFWDYELDRQILEEEGWQDLAAKGFDPPRRFAAFLHTLRRPIRATHNRPVAGSSPAGPTSESTLFRGPVATPSGSPSPGRHPSRRPLS